MAKTTTSKAAKKEKPAAKKTTAASSEAKTAKAAKSGSGNKASAHRGIKKTKKVEAKKVETNLVRRVTLKKAKNSKIADFSAGDTVNVNVKIIEGEKERVQLYKGVVTKIQGHSHKTFTVRKVSAGIGVERTFPFNSPAIESVEVVSYGKVRRAKLYYLRNLDGKAARIESELAPTGSAAEALAESANAAKTEVK